MNARLWVRLAIVLSATVYMQWGPFLRTGLGWSIDPPLHSWRMYHNRGKDQCKMQAWLLENGEPVAQVDWLQRMGAGAWYEAPRSTIEVQSHTSAVKRARAACEGLSLEQGLSVVTQCAGPGRRWMPPSDTQRENVCSLKALLKPRRAP